MKKTKLEKMRNADEDTIDRNKRWRRLEMEYSCKE